MTAFQLPGSMFAARVPALALLLLTQHSGAQVAVAPGYEVRQLATGIDRPYAAAGPAAGGYSGDLYVTTGATQQIVRIDTSGTVTPFADLSALVPFDALFWPSFDVVGNYGGLLYVDDDNPALPDRVYSVTPGGAGAAFVVGPGTDNDALAFDPFGAFGGALFLHDGASKATLYRVDPSGAVGAFATGVADLAAQIAFSPGGAFGNSIYIAGEASGKIYTIPPSHVPGQPATLFPGFQASSPTVLPGGIAISDAGPFGTDVLYVNDKNTSSVVTISPAGETTGTFLTGLAGTALLHLPRLGDFAGTMVLTDLGDGSIYLVTACPSAAAAQVSRAGNPANPDVLQPGVTSGPLLGSTWDPVISHTAFMPGAITDLLGITVNPLNLVAPPFGTLLCDPTLIVAIETVAAGLPFAVEIPTDCIFVGLAVCTQGASSDGAQVLLTNALDITIGTF